MDLGGGVLPKLILIRIIFVMLFGDFVYIYSKDCDQDTIRLGL